MARNRLKSLGLFAAGGLTTYGVLEALKTSDWSGSSWPASAKSAKSFTNLLVNNSENKTLESSQEVELQKPFNKTFVLQKSTLPAVTSELKSPEYVEAAGAAASKLNQWRTANQIPGYVVGISVRGQKVWMHADGFADIENGIPCKVDTVMRIASISKAITSAILGRLLEEKKIDLDKPIRAYLTPDQWPDKSWEGEPVEITLRQLASHLGGIRHYKKDNTPSPTTSDTGDGQFSEFYLYKNFPSVLDSLSIFKDDPLVAKPGTKYHYTTFGFTLISAVLESALKEAKDEKSSSFPQELKRLFTRLGMRQTYLDENSPLIYNRASYYFVDKKTGRLTNVPAIDASYKWAGGGLLSTAVSFVVSVMTSLKPFSSRQSNWRKVTVNKVVKQLSTLGQRFSVGSEDMKQSFRHPLCL